ncbi:MAG: hypothetical protein LBO62_00030, partial [Endomicrobium sp.]|nr:hypothetical protein [Endomicrobium sp.]
MKIKEKVLEYFALYWKRNIFMKSVSLAVALCFLVNIANLPVYAASDDDLLKKQIKAADQASVSNTGIAKPVSEQISGAAAIKADISAAARKELDRKDITITSVGAIVEKSRDGKSERMVGSLDEKGKVRIHSGDSGKPFDKKTKEEYEFRTQQILNSGVPRGKYAATHSREYLALEKSGKLAETSQVAKETAETGVKKEEKVKEKEDVGISEGLKVKTAAQEVQGERREIIQGQNINEQSAQAKQNAIKELIKKKDTASVSKATIAKVQKIGNDAGLKLVGKINASESEAKIELYTSKYTGDSVFVGKAEGLMVYATLEGNIEVANAIKKINIGGNEFESTGVSLVRGFPQEKDDAVNKNLEGVFFVELFNVVDGSLGGEKMRAVKESLTTAKGEKTVVQMPGNVVRYIEDKAGAELSERAINAVKSMGLAADATIGSAQYAFEAVNKGVLALQPVLTQAATGKSYKGGVGLPDTVLYGVNNLGSAIDATSEGFGYAFEASNKGVFALQPALTQAATGKSYKGGVGLPATVLYGVNNLGSVIDATSEGFGSTFEASNKGVLALQPVLTQAALGNYSKNNEVSKTAADENITKESEENTKAAEEKKESKIEDGAEYQNVVKRMAQDTGQSEADVKKTLEGISEEQLSVLNDFYKDKDATIINCAADALVNMIGGGISKGLLALQALAVDIASGVFGKESVKDGQINTSMTAINQTLNDNGVKSAAYGISLDEFKDGLTEGESAVLWVDGNHYITVTKEDKDSFSVEDPNKNGGEKITYNGENFEKLMNGEEAAGVDANGQNTTQKGYSVDADDIKVVANSEKGISKKAAQGKARVLDSAETDAITGSKYVMQSVQVAVPKTKTETRTGIRTEERTGTRPSIDSEGNETSESYSYSVEVEYQYEVQVEYIDYEMQEEMVWVDDPEDNETSQEDKDARAKAEQEAQDARLKAETERLEAEIAKRNAEAEEQARRDALEGKNTLKDEDGNEIKKEVSQERAQEIKEGQAGKQTELNNDVKETAQASVESSKASKEAADKVAALAAGDSKEDKAVAERLQKEAADGLTRAEKTFEQTEKAGNLSVDNGVIYERDGDKIKEIGIWDGEKAYIAQADGQLKEDLSYTELISNKEKIGQVAEGDKLDKETVSKISDFISSIVSNESVNCAVDAISQILDATNKGLLAFQTVIADLAAGVFVSNNQAYLSGESQDVMISMESMKAVLNSYGKDFEGYSAKVDDAAASLKEGESAVLHVKVDSGAASENHFITIELAKDEDGNVIIAAGEDGAQDRYVTIRDVNKDNRTLKESELG